MFFDHHSDRAWADGDNWEGGPGYDVNMRWVYEHQKCESGVDQSCVKHYKGSGNESKVCDCVISMP